MFTEKMLFQFKKRYMTLDRVRKIGDIRDAPDVNICTTARILSPSEDLVRREYLLEVEAITSVQENVEGVAVDELSIQKRPKYVSLVLDISNKQVFSWKREDNG